MPALKHVHMYERSRGNKEIYRCTDPDCSHYLERGLIVGKHIRCFKCGDIAVARQEQVKAGQEKVGVRQLTCIPCSKSKVASEMRAIKEMVMDANRDVDGLTELFRDIIPPSSDKGKNDPTSSN